jgi:hypothetical protein
MALATSMPVPSFWPSGPAALAPPVADNHRLPVASSFPSATSAGRDPSDERAADLVGVIAPYQGTTGHPAAPT